MNKHKSHVFLELPWKYSGCNICSELLLKLTIQLPVGTHLHIQFMRCNMAFDEVIERPFQRLQHGLFLSSFFIRLFPLQKSPGQHCCGERHREAKFYMISSYNQMTNEQELH